VALFWADVDTTKNGGRTYYRNVTGKAAVTNYNESISIRLLFEFDSIPVRPSYDHSTTYVETAA